MLVSENHKLLNKESLLNLRVWGPLGITEPASSHLPQAEGDPELFLQREHTMPKAASKLAAAPSTPPANISKTPAAVHNSSIPTTSLLNGSTEPTVTVPDHGGLQKREK